MTIAQLAPLPLRIFGRGKVREVYVVDDERLLLVATDRVSAFDVVMAEAMPYKGAVLTQMTAWWLRQLEGDVEHHMLVGERAMRSSTRSRRSPPHRDVLAGRAMLCRRTEVFPIECVCAVIFPARRGRSTRQRGTLAGESLAPGLRESDRLDPPLFSPATKAETGHDENITVARDARRLIGAGRCARELERLSRLVYERGRELAAARGIIIADTKFEFGRDRRTGAITLIDEVLTPDSSRFWPADQYQPGRSQPSFDKQPLRDYLDAERRAGRWNGDAPPPPLPAAVVAGDERALPRCLPPRHRHRARSRGALVNFAREGLPLHRHRGAHRRGGAVRRRARRAARGRCGCSRSRSRSSRSGSRTSSATPSAPASAATRS